MLSFFRPFFLPAAAALLGLTLLSPTTSGADETFLGAIGLLDDPQVASQLELPAEAVEKLKTLAAERESAAIEFTLSIKDLPAADRAAKLAEFRGETERLGFALLTPDQQAKLKQIQVGKAGVQAFADPQIVEQLALSDDQKAKVSALLVELQRATTQGSEAQRRFARARLERDILEVLTPEQKANWQKLTGRLAADAAVPMGAEAAAPMATGAPPSTPLPAEAPDASTASANTPKPTAPPSRSTTPEAAANTSTATNKNGEVKLKFNFRFAPWKDVLDWFAEQADMSLVMDAPPQGTFNYSDTRAYTPAEAIDLLNGVLLTKGYTLVRRERMLMLFNLEDGQLPPPLVPDVELADLDKKGDFELVRVLFKLSKLTPEEAEPELRKLIGPQGAVVMLPKARQVLVTETAGKLRTIRSIIEAIENPPAATDEAVSVVELQFVTPSEFLSVARQLLGMPENINSTPDGSLRLAIDELGNRILATGKAERIERLQEIVKLVDVGVPGDESAGGPIEQPQLEVYSVTSADPAAVLQVMQTLMSGLPDVRLTTDPKTGNLVALAKPSQHATIKATLDQLQRDGTQVEVIKLRRLDPQAAVLAINKLFGAGEEGAAANGPKVDADPTSMQLMIRGNAAQVTQIRDLLTKMGETEDGAIDDDVERSNVRVLPYSGRTLESALEQIEGVWPTMHRNRIRIRRPSQSAPGIRARGVPPLETEEDPLEALGIPNDPALGLDQATRERLQDMLRPLNGGPTRAADPAFDIDRPTIEAPLENPRRPDGDRSLRNPPAGSLRPRPAPPATVPQVAPPAATPPATPADDRSTHMLPALPHGMQFVAQIAEAESTEESAPPAAAAPAAGDSAAEILEKPPGQESVPGADIIVTVGPGGVMIASEDLDALDDFEQLLQSVADTNAASGREYNVFYLKFARAEVAATLVQEAIGGGMPDSDDGGGSLMGDIAANMMGDAGGGLLGGLLGLGGGGGGGGSTASSSSTGVSIIPDPRLNALMVLAKPKDLDMIEQLLQVIDQPASPENVQTVAAPRFIPVNNSDAAEIATVVRQVYASRLAADASQPRQPSPEDLIRALRGGRGGRGGGAGGQNNRGEEQKMTIGVDTRTNSLIVSAPDYLFQEVKALVEELDSAVLNSDETVRVVTLKRANADVVQRSLVSVLGDSVTTNRTGSSSSSSNNSSSRSGSSSSRRSGDSGRRGSGGSSGDQMRQQIEMFQNIQRGMQGGGGFGGGGFGRGGGGRSGRGR